MNNKRGEVRREICGKPYVFLLTLGALARIESEMGITDLSQIDSAVQSLNSGSIRILLKSLHRPEPGEVRLRDEDIHDWDLSVSEIVELVQEIFSASMGPVDNTSSVGNGEGAPAEKS